ncbi:amino acid ABC transporter ATP-binding protein [Deinococcus piscis]|uniref:Amino acid ABC transporter ATP-binding protein n=1 Tax=Deinococcus piscis TaxID=394230 RepID=A0ABQ3K1E1_9DEIO|nr:ABC transporter ATP-binding protein [Deinococcus piscis]GHF95446.1 amino acid ABC transporter ATP-binding protein [Deinococcus piscis]
MIEFREVTKQFAGGPPVLNGITLAVPDGELVVLIGPSGSGKSTLMRLVNRLIEPTSGSVWVDGRNVADVNVVELRRNIGYVIQSVGLFPHLTVAQNVELVPSITGVPAAQRRRRAEDLLHLMGLEPAAYAERYPRQLSGGQQQRVGIARALAADPAYLLMDEPFSALDPITREALQEQFLQLKRELGQTILFVTHDVEEAVRLGDHICLLGDGVIQQFGPPDELLHRPANDFVASFMGDSRELLRLGLRTAADYMRPPDPAARGQVGLDWPADRALSALLGAGGAAMQVVAPSGEVVGSLRLSDFAGSSQAQQPAGEPGA